MQMAGLPLSACLLLSHMYGHIRIWVEGNILDICAQNKQKIIISKEWSEKWMEKHFVFRQPKHIKISLLLWGGIVITNKTIKRSMSDLILILKLGTILEMFFSWWWINKKSKNLNQKNAKNNQKRINHNH